MMTDMKYAYLYSIEETPFLKCVSTATEEQIAGVAASLAQSESPEVPWVKDGMPEFVAVTLRRDEAVHQQRLREFVEVQQMQKLISPIPRRSGHRSS